MGEAGGQEMMKTHDVEQGTPEWFAIRAGLPTASEFATVLAKGTDRKSPSVTRHKYLLKLAGEIITGEPEESYSNFHMERGRQMEAEARDLDTFVQDEPLTRVGFITNGPKGCSPDSLVGESGMVEFKTAIPSVLGDKLLKGGFPPEHKAQCQGSLWVAEREWIDLCVFWPKMPMLRVRAHRDDAYIKSLSEAVDQFNEELAEIVDRLRNYGRPLAETLNASLSEAAA